MRMQGPPRCAREHILYNAQAGELVDRVALTQDAVALHLLLLLCICCPCFALAVVAVHCK